MVFTIVLEPRKVYKQLSKDLERHMIVSWLGLGVIPRVKEHELAESERGSPGARATCVYCIM